MYCRVSAVLKRNTNQGRESQACPAARASRASPRERFGVSCGFTLVELSFVLLLGMVMMAISVPIIQSALYGYRLRSAVASATWAIQATRYQAIMKGYPFALAFDSTALTYQVSSQPPGAPGFSNLGSAVPLSGSNVSLSQSTTLQFKPNGIVQATTGQLIFSIGYQGNTKTITVSSYGDVSVSP